MFVQEQMVRGMYVTLCMQFIEKYYTPEQRALIHEQLSPDLKAAKSSIKPGEWYPLHFATDQTRGIFNSYDNREEAEAALKRCGKFIGEQASNTFLRLLMKMLTLKMMLSKWPEFWRKYHNFGELRVELAGPNHLVFFLNPGYPYMYRLGPGWIEVACVALGLKNVVMKDNVPPGEISAPEIRIDVTYTK
jgi:hypothetical protein